MLLFNSDGSPVIYCAICLARHQDDPRPAVTYLMGNALCEKHIKELAIEMKVIGFEPNTAIWNVIMS